jgi:1-acyl-sn-glycerol-3-phosphate acyltransferase
MNRFQLGKIVKFFFHWHYDVQVSGEELLRDGKTHLVMPNHSAYIDPLILFSEEWWLPLRPLTDELFMRHWFYGRVLRMADAIEVPDLNKVKGEGVKSPKEEIDSSRAHTSTPENAESLKEKAEAASRLSRIVIESLAEGKEICFYPSGHVKTVDKEIIGNRRLAYEVCGALPDGVRVILCRMRGLESSRWSKLKPKQWKWRRTVTLHFEDHTEDVQTWAQTLDRRAFNQKLEEWYNG